MAVFRVLLAGEHGAQDLVEFFALFMEEEAASVGVQAAIGVHQGFQEGEDGRKPAAILADALEDVRNLFGAICEIGPEQRGADDFEGEFAHVGADIDFRTFFPSGGHALAGFDHDLGVAGDLFLMKGGLEHAAAFLMQRFFAGDEAVADQFAQEFRAGITFEAVLAGDQDLFDEFGVIHHIDAAVQDAEAGDGAVALRRLLKEGERAAYVSPAEEAKNFCTARTWWHVHDLIFA